MGDDAGLHSVPERPTWIIVGQGPTVRVRVVRTIFDFPFPLHIPFLFPSLC